MRNMIQSAISLMVQYQNDLNVMKDIIIPFISVLLGAFVGGMISYKLSLKLMKKNNEFDLLDKAYTVIYQMSDVTFFLALNIDNEEYFDIFSERFKVFREFFSLRINQELINKDPSNLFVKMSEIAVQRNSPKEYCIKQCFELNHELQKLQKTINDKMSLIHT